MSSIRGSGGNVANQFALRVSGGDNDGNVSGTRRPDSSSTTRNSTGLTPRAVTTTTAQYPRQTVTSSGLATDLTRRSRPPSLDRGGSLQQAAGLGNALQPELSPPTYEASEQAHTRQQEMSLAAAAGLSAQRGRRSRSDEVTEQDNRPEPPAYSVSLQALTREEALTLAAGLSAQRHRQPPDYEATEQDDELRQTEATSRGPILDLEVGYDVGDALSRLGQNE